MSGHAGHGRLALYCFAHAGGGAGFFRPWRVRLGPEIDVRPVVLPGRESRVREEPFRTMAPLVADVVADLDDGLDGPYALFGHSLGSAVAYEVALAMRRRGAPAPAAVVVSGRRAPHLPSRRAPLADMDEPQLLVEMAELGGTPAELLGQTDLLRLFLPTVRADFAVNESYVPTAAEPLDCPVFGFVGDRDPLATPDEVSGWRSVTTGRFGLRVFRGDHFYLQEGPAGVIAAIRSDLRPAVAAAAAEPEFRTEYSADLVEEFLAA